MQKAAKIFGVQESYRDRVNLALKSLSEAKEFIEIYRNLYDRIGKEFRVPGPELRRDEILYANKNFVVNLYNGILENCIGKYSEEVIRSLFGGKKIKENSQGSSLDLFIGQAINFAIEVKSCRWSNKEWRTPQGTERKYPIGRSMYYIKRNQLAQAELQQASESCFYAFVDYDFKGREQLSFSEVRAAIMSEFKRTKIHDPSESLEWFGQQVSIKGIWLVPTHYLTHIWNKNIMTTRVDRGANARKHTIQKFTQFYFKWALEEMDRDLARHGNIAKSEIVQNLPGEPFEVRVHSGILFPGNSPLPAGSAQGNFNFS